MTKNRNSDYNIPLESINDGAVEVEITEVMSKLLNIPLEDIIKSRELFSNIKPNVETCFLKLYAMKESDYVNAFMVFEFLTFYDKAIDEVLD